MVIFFNNIYGKLATAKHKCKSITSAMEYWPCSPVPQVNFPLRVRTQQGEFESWFNTSRDIPLDFRVKIGLVRSRFQGYGGISLGKEQRSVHPGGKMPKWGTLQP